MRKRRAKRALWFRRLLSSVGLEEVSTALILKYHVADDEDEPGEEGDVHVGGQNSDAESLAHGGLDEVAEGEAEATKEAA
eukprot:CAMPEP_0168612142 /NCGR_PEP_ID=MMETSP0449_2-20121227/2749_1 /TAXON_ID=1082188 /ORGANISM="Strombidium rassoulzadegani, Strain ras09" /LENGTH=79 /DNA_ID=CAMNT_0008652667 /DNA_START=1059 /DNA_END=1298 /DNA_ORIENTATION=+